MLSTQGLGLKPEWILSSAAGQLSGRGKVTPPPAPHAPGAHVGVVMTSRGCCTAWLGRAPRRGRELGSVLRLHPAGVHSQCLSLPRGSGTVPPHISGPGSEQVTAILNSSVALPCDVRAHPSPEVTWYKDSQALPLGEGVFLLPGGCPRRGAQLGGDHLGAGGQPAGLMPHPTAGTHTLQLARVQPADSGTYLCEALNAAGRDQRLVQLSVLGTSRLRHPRSSASPLPAARRQHSRERPPGSLGCRAPCSDGVGLQTGGSGQGLQTGRI